MAQLTMKKCWNCNSEVVITSGQCPFCKARLGLVGTDGVAAKGVAPTGFGAVLESITQRLKKGWSKLRPVQKFFVVFICLSPLLPVLSCLVTFQNDHYRAAVAQEDAKEAAVQAAVAKVETQRLAAVEAAKTPEQRAVEAKARAVAQKAAAAAAEAQRRAAAAHARDEIVIPMGFPDNFSVGLSMVELKRQMFKQLTALQASGQLGATSGVTFEVTAKMTDQYGDSNTDSLMTLRFRGDDLRRINWENMDNWKVMGLCHALARTKEAEGILITFSQTSNMRTSAPEFANQIR